MPDETNKMASNSTQARVSSSPLLALPADVLGIVLHHASKHRAYVPGLTSVCKKFQQTYHNVLSARLQAQVAKRFPEFVEGTAAEKLHKYLEELLANALAQFDSKEEIMKNLQGSDLELPIKILYEKLGKSFDGVNDAVVLTMHKQWMKDINYMHLHHKLPRAKL